nr:MAG TPA: hypothetical protein [Bacteriophage sp.]
MLLYQRIYFSHSRLCLCISRKSILHLCFSYPSRDYSFCSCHFCIVF